MRNSDLGNIVTEDCKTIEEVIKKLEAIIQTSQDLNSPFGYFASLYCLVTKRVAEGINKKEFDDNPGMEKLDVAFANRYFEAFRNYHQQKECPKCWQIAFEATSKRSLIVLQHLALGMHAHISFDLGLSVSEIYQTKDLDRIKGDFLLINQILKSLIDDVQDKLTDVWPFLKMLDLSFGKMDELFSGLGITLSRDFAWEVAKKSCALAGNEKQDYIRNLDEELSCLSEKVKSPRFFLRLPLLMIRLTEKQQPRDIIQILTH